MKYPTLAKSSGAMEASLSVRLGLEEEAQLTSAFAGQINRYQAIIATARRRQMCLQNPEARKRLLELEALGR
jgi:hypothetical protein